MICGNCGCSIVPVMSTMGDSFEAIKGYRHPRGHNFNCPCRKPSPIPSQVKEPKMEVKK